MIGFFCFFSSVEGFSQGVSINSTGNPPEASAGLDVDFTNRGMLLPRLTKLQRDAISSPATGLLIFQTDNTPGYYFFDGSTWQSFIFGVSNLNNWTKSGNDLYNNNTGNTGIGTTTFDATNPEKLKVDAGTTTSKNVISGYGSIDSYLQLNIRNTSNGVNASSDVIATNDAGDENKGYIDLGINSSNYNQAAYNIGGKNDAYLYCVGNTGGSPQGGNLSIGTASGSTSIRFHTGGTTTAFERMRVDANGYVGIGTTGPAGILDVQGGTAGSNIDGKPVTIYAQNGGTNNKAGGDIILKPGNGGGTGSPGSFKLLNGSGSGYFGLLVPPGAVSKSYTLPADDGANNAALVTSGAGVLSWGSPLSSGTVSGLAGQIGFYSGANTLIGNNDLYWDNSNIRLGIGTTSPSKEISLNGNAGRGFWMERNTTSNTIGNSLIIQAGGATLNGTDKAGGDLILQSGIATGNRASNIIFSTAGGGSTGTTDAAPTEHARFNGVGYLGLGTNNPTNLLEINSPSGSGLRLNNMPGGAVLFMSTSKDVAQNNNNFFFDVTNYRLSIGAGTTPNSTLQVGGSLSVATVTKTSDYTASVNDYTILCNSSSPITITLPDPTGVTGRIYVIKNINTGTVTISKSSFTIDGAATQTLTTIYASITVQSNGTTWYILSRYLN